MARRWYEGKTPAQLVHYRSNRLSMKIAVCGEVVGRIVRRRADVTCMACLRATDPVDLRRGEEVEV